MRQFDLTNKSVSSHIDYDPKEFVKKINEFYEQQNKATNGKALVDGYAPFCKHLFVPNFTPALVTYVDITDQNRHLLRTEYVARTETELPVLTRFFPKDAVAVPRAKFLDIILYSREQIKKENAATGTVCTDTAPWGIVSVRPQDSDHEQPMMPITMMRNALGTKEGGSGVPLERDAYMKAVNFWRTRASLS